MAENVVINFEASLEGFEPLIKALKDVGTLTEKQAADFLSLEKKQQEQLSKTTTQLKEQTSEVGKLTANIKNLGEGAAGGAIKQATTNFSKLDTQANKLADTLVELLSTGKGNTAEFKKLVKELYDTEASLRGVDSGSKKLTTQLREMKNELSQMDEGSAEFQKLAIEAAKLEDRIGDINERVRVMASDTFAFDAMVDGIRGVTAAFAIAQSASALLGDENEDLQKALLKVQAATGLLIGVQEISNQLKGQGAAKLAILSAAQKAYAFVMTGATAAVRTFNAALLATGFGAIIVLVGLLVANWEKLKEVVGLTTENIKEQREALIEYNNTVDDINNKINESERIRRDAAEGGINEIKRRIDLLKAQGADEAKIFDFQQLLRRKELAELRIQLEEVKKIRTGSIADRINLETQAQEKIKDKENEIQVATEARLTKLREELEKSRKPVDNLKAEFIELKKSIDGIASKKIVIEAEIKTTLSTENEINGYLEKKLQAELEAEEEKQEQIKDAAINSAQIVSDALFQIGAQRRQAELNEELDKLDKQKQAELDAVGDNAKAREAIEAKYRKKEAQIKRQAFQQEKQAAIIQATINTALAIVKALPNPIAAALAGLAGAAQIAVIASQPIPQFRKGTKSAPEGMALVGEGGPELVHLPRGAKVITHPETKNFLNGVNVADIIAKYNLPSVAQHRLTGTESVSSSLDYGRLGSEIAKHRSIFQVNIDENGFETRIKKGLEERVYLNNRFSVK